MNFQMAAQRLPSQSRSCDTLTNNQQINCRISHTFDVLARENIFDQVSYVNLKTPLFTKRDYSRSSTAGELFA